MVRRPAAALAGAVVWAAALAATGLAFHLDPSLERLDARGLDWFTRVREHDVDGVLTTVVHLADPLPYLFLAAAVVVAALRAGRPRAAVLLGLVLVAAPATAELLKEATAQTRARSVRFADHIDRASWPSGHATAAATLALTAIVAAPRALKALVALGGALFAAAIGVAVVALVWHFPSDVLGAYLLAAAWVSLAAAAIGRYEPEREAPGSHSGSAPVSAWLAPRLRMNSRSDSRLR